MAILALFAVLVIWLWIDMQAVKRVYVEIDLIRSFVKLQKLRKTRNL